MDDELKSAWQSQSSPQRLTLDTGLLLAEVRRNERQFAATIYSRDIREVGVALLLVPVWIFMGVWNDSPWTWYLVIPTLFWIAGFMIVDRIRQRRRRPVPGDNLRRSIEGSLAQVEHQIWLLRNILWWYLLPPFVALMMFFAHTAWQSRAEWLEALVKFAGPTAAVALVYWFLYWLNQLAVRKQLQPRRRELQTLLASLNEAAEENSHRSPT